MAANDLIDIAITSNNEPNDELIQNLANILNQDLGHVRSIVASRDPRIIVQQTNLKEVEKILQQIENLGFISFSCEDNKLRKPFRFFKANAIEFGNKEIIFKDKATQLYRLQKENAFLIIKRILKTYEENEIITEVKKLNITATLMMGGIPIRRTEKRKATETTIKCEGIIRLFEKNSMDFCRTVSRGRLDST